jgi:DNA-directed RNA polymerase subunit RPC12/RpoP
MKHAELRGKQTGITTGAPTHQTTARNRAMRLYAYPCDRCSMPYTTDDLDETLCPECRDTLALMAEPLHDRTDEARGLR